MQTKQVILNIPICAICAKFPPRSDWADFENMGILPTQWTAVHHEVICQDCVNELRVMFMAEQQPKIGENVSGAFTTVEDNGVVGLVEKREEHWLTRNGTRVIVRVPLPGVGHLVSIPPSPSDKRHILRWDDKYNCVEASFSKDPAVLALYDLIERLEQSVKKDQI